MEKYKLTILFGGIVFHPFNGYHCNSFTVTVSEDDIDDDGKFIRIGEYLYPVHNINCIKREIVKDEVQGKVDDQANGGVIARHVDKVLNVRLKRAESLRQQQEQKSCPALIKTLTSFQ